MSATKRAKRREKRGWLDETPYYRRKCEELTPNRARAVLKYIALGEQHMPGQTYPRSAFNRSPVAGSGPAQQRRSHPATMAQKARQKLSKRMPDPEQRERERIKHRFSQIVGEQPDFGLGGGALEIAAEHYAPLLQLEHDLVDDTERAAITQYLLGVWGEVIHAFPQAPDLPGYHEWRQQCRERTT